MLCVCAMCAWRLDTPPPLRPTTPPSNHPHRLSWDAQMQKWERNQSDTPGCSDITMTQTHNTIRSYAFCSLIPGVYTVFICVCGDTRSSRASSARCHSERLCNRPLPPLICLLLPELSKPWHVCASVYLSMCTAYTPFPTMGYCNPHCQCVCAFVHVWAHHVIFHSLPTGIRPFISQAPV